MTKQKNKKFNIPPKLIRIPVLIIYDIFAITLSMFMALYVRFDMRFESIEPLFLDSINFYVSINIIITISVFFILRLYNSLWRYASVSELIVIIVGCGISSCSQILGMNLLHLPIPRSYYIMYLFFLLMSVSCGRFFYRFCRMFSRTIRRRNNPSVKNTMIIGAGDAGMILLNELRTSYYSNFEVKCIIDDDETKLHKTLHGVPIVGGRDKIVESVADYDIHEIIIAIPTLSAKEKKSILEICNETECNIQTLPSLSQIANNEVSVSALRQVSIDDLLGREPIKTKIDTILEKIRGKVVMVTGGGGSIGSELCRQIANHEPKQLIIFDIYENNAYDIQQELKRSHPGLNLVVLIGSVRNTHRVEKIFEKYRPQIVYHAAAHKHVPLMEASPNEAIKNNVVGTYNTAVMADKFGVDTFVLISTDKAVNPTNIMGASKRICEKVIQSMDEKSDTKFVAVRFGNVLGSNGSVIPLFQKQIKEGGPVTVTHKDIIRYFMTIPEAVSLVLQAGAYAKGGEIFVLDMGDPVRIDDLARKLIRLSGLKPDEDIEIVYTGLRPGEKLFEEKLMDEEGLEKTENELIHIGKPIIFDKKKFLEDVKELKLLAYEDLEDNSIYRKVKEMVPTFQWEE